MFYLACRVLLKKKKNFELCLDIFIGKKKNPDLQFVLKFGDPGSTREEKPGKPGSLGSPADLLCLVALLSTTMLPSCLGLSELLGDQVPEMAQPLSLIPWTFP